MIGIGEITIVALIVAIFFFGKKQIIDWAKTLGQVKKTYNNETIVDKNK